MNDLISRQVAIDAINKAFERVFAWDGTSPLGDKVLENVPSAEPKQRWIPVSERLPEPRVDVWVNSDIGQIQGYYEERVGVWYASFGQGRDYLELIVNAWMPLPEPYREERTEE